MQDLVCEKPGVNAGNSTTLTTATWESTSHTHTRTDTQTLHIDTAWAVRSYPAQPRFHFRKPLPSTAQWPTVCSLPTSQPRANLRSFPRSSAAVKACHFVAIWWVYNGDINASLIRFLTVASCLLFPMSPVVGVKNMVIFKHVSGQNWLCLPHWKRSLNRSQCTSNEWRGDLGLGVGGRTRQTVQL